jgi:hypothetical protein
MPAGKNLFCPPELVVIEDVGKSKPPLPLKTQGTGGGGQ